MGAVGGVAAEQPGRRRRAGSGQAGSQQRGAARQVRSGRRILRCSIRSTTSPPLLRLLCVIERGARQGRVLTLPLFDRRRTSARNMGGYLVSVGATATRPGIRVVACERTLLSRRRCDRGPTRATLPRISPPIRPRRCGSGDCALAMACGPVICSVNTELLLERCELRDEARRLFGDLMLVLLASTRGHRAPAASHGIRSGSVAIELRTASASPRRG